jgi:hypothetical protein
MSDDFSKQVKISKDQKPISTKKLDGHYRYFPFFCFHNFDFHVLGIDIGFVHEKSKNFN